MNIKITNQDNNTQRENKFNKKNSFFKKKGVPLKSKKKINSFTISDSLKSIIKMNYNFNNIKKLSRMINKKINKESSDIKEE